MNHQHGRTARHCRGHRRPAPRRGRRHGCTRARCSRTYHRLGHRRRHRRRRRARIRPPLGSRAHAAAGRRRRKRPAGRKPPHVEPLLTAPPCPPVFARVFARSSRQHHAHRQVDHLAAAGSLRQCGTCAGESRRPLGGAGGDHTAEGAQHVDDVADRNRALEPERGADDVLEQPRLGQRDVVVAPRPCFTFRLGLGGRPAKPVEVTHPLDVAVAARPNHPEAVAVTQDPPDLGDGPFGIKPVPCR